jgi:hypothetical protein
VNTSGRIRQPAATKQEQANQSKFRRRTIPRSKKGRSKNKRSSSKTTRDAGTETLSREQHTRTQRNRKKEHRNNRQEKKRKNREPTHIQQGTRTPGIVYMMFVFTNALGALSEPPKTDEKKAGLTDNRLTA